MSGGCVILWTKCDAELRGISLYFDALMPMRHDALCGALPLAAARGASPRPSARPCRRRSADGDASAVASARVGICWRKAVGVAMAVAHLRRTPRARARADARARMPKLCSICKNAIKRYPHPGSAPPSPIDRVPRPTPELLQHGCSSAKSDLRRHTRTRGMHRGTAPTTAPSATRALALHRGC